MGGICRAVEGRGRRGVSKHTYHNDETKPRECNNDSESETITIP